MGRAWVTSRVPVPWAHEVRVTLPQPGHGHLIVDEHLRVALPAPHPWPSLADVLVGPGTGHGAADALAASHPGAAVVAVHDGTRPRMCRLRLGPYGIDAVRLTLTAGHAAMCCWDTWASLAHAWLVAGLPPEGLSAEGLSADGLSCMTVPREHLAQSAAAPSSPSPRSRSRTSSAGPARFTAT